MKRLIGSGMAAFLCATMLTVANPAPVHAASFDCDTTMTVLNARVEVLQATAGQLFAAIDHYGDVLNSMDDPNSDYTPAKLGAAAAAVWDLAARVVDQNTLVWESYMKMEQEGCGK